MSVTLLQKDQEWIDSKKDKIHAELKLITEQGTSVNLLGVTSRISAKRLKKWQLQIMNEIQTVSVEQLIKNFQKTKSEMCQACQNNLRNGDLQCQADLKKFIMCDSISKSIVSFWGVSE